MRRQGYKILYHRWRRGSHEIDLIAWHQGELTFIEVRTLAAHVPWLPEDTIRVRKQQRLRRAIEAFLHENPSYENLPARVDIVAVRLTVPPQFELIMDAFR